jgi:hypothetical protein
LAPILLTVEVMGILGEGNFLLALAELAKLEQQQQQ